MAKNGRKKNLERELVWHKLSKESKDLYVTLLWKEGYTEQAIANFFQTTKGPIVSYRNRVLKLSSEGRTLKKSEITRQNLRDLLVIDQLDELKDKGGIPTPDFFAGDVPPSTAPHEVVERAIQEGKVTPLRPAERPEEPEDEEASAETEPVRPQEMEETETSIPSFADPPFLPPPDAQEQSAPLEEIPETVIERVTPEPFPTPKTASARFIAEDVTECEYPKANGKPCGKIVRPGSKLCDEHVDLARKSRSL